MEKHTMFLNMDSLSIKRELCNHLFYFPKSLGDKMIVLSGAVNRLGLGNRGEAGDCGIMALESSL